MRAIAFVIISLLVAAIGAVLVTAPPARAGTLINDRLVESSGPTTALGGGDYLFVRFGTDAAFGVVYGSAADPNNVYIVAIKARYLGVSQVYDQNGNRLGENRPAKVYTLYAVKLDNIVEFEDQDGNHVADYQRSVSGGNFSGYVPQTDTFYKRVSLDTAWNRSAITRANGTEWRSWTFSLEARNLSYQAVANYTGSTAGVLPLVRFTFHLNASLEQVDNATVPNWRVTVGQVGARYYVTDLERLANLTVSGKVVHYDLKWDQEIQGWSYSQGNNPPRRHLLLEMGGLVGNFIPYTIVDAWFESRAIARMGESGEARYDATTGAGTANDTTGPYTTVRALRSPYVDFGGDWTRIARLVWKADSTVDGAAETVYGQVMGGWRFGVVGEAGNVFAGFVILAGLSFIGGNTIVHDPSVVTDVQADLQLPGMTPENAARALLVATVVVVVLVAALLLVVLALSKRRSKTPPAP